MKYIRTKDGIFEVVKEDDEWVDIISNFERRMKCQCCIKKKGIIKQADTIEELCDEFVGIRRSDDTAHLGKIKDRHWFHEKTGWIGRVENYKVFYGAIWTDKGLIYVAKMNEKGELELL